MLFQSLTCHPVWKWRSKRDGELKKAFIDDGHKTKVLIYNIFISQSIPIVKSGDEKRALKLKCRKQLMAKASKVFDCDTYKQALRGLFVTGTSDVD